MGLSKEVVQYYRELAVAVLRTNPFKHKKISGNLKGNQDGMYCAVGELAYAFQISPDIAGSGQVYYGVAERLGEKDTTFIFQANDSGVSWETIGDTLAERWHVK